VGAFLELSSEDESLPPVEPVSLKDLEKLYANDEYVQNDALLRVKVLELSSLEEKVTEEFNGCSLLYLLSSL
jgi:hypothetical protein